MCLWGGLECFCKHVQLFKLQASNKRLPVETLCNDAFPRMLTEGAQGRTYIAMQTVTSRSLERSLSKISKV